MRRNDTSPTVTAQVEAAIRRLYDVGGHLLPTRLELDPGDPDKLRKIPARKGWQVRRMKPATALAHLRRPLPADRPHVVGHGLGIIPASLEAIAADLDEGDRREFWRIAGEPWEWLETRRGSHSFYDHDGPELTRRPFAIGDCRGELIGSRQFVQLHGLEAIVRLADALPRRGTSALQLELFDPVTVETPRGRRARTTARPKEAGPVPCPGELATAVEGVRHRTLFWWGRHWAYRERRGDSYGRWESRVRMQFAGLHVVMPAPRLPRPEVERMAVDVASWVWDRPPFERGWITQFYRGLKREYGGVTRDRVVAVWKRNRAIVAAIEAGHSRRAVAREYGLHYETVRRLLRHAEDWISPDAREEALAGIWGPGNPPDPARGRSRRA